MKKFIIFLAFYCFSFAIFADVSMDRLNQPASWQSIKHVIIVVLENAESSDAIQQPFMKELALKGAYLSNYFAVKRPSQPNYLAMVGGSTFHVFTNFNVTICAKHIGDLLEEKGLTWKAYAEDYPGHCYLGSKAGEYVRKHVPFISFKNVTSNPLNCNKVVPATEFFTDVANNQLPSFSFFTPNLKNSGHDTGVQYADKWLAKAFGPIVNNPDIMKDTLFIVTFDEDKHYISDNKVYIALVGPSVIPASRSRMHYTHYSLLRTIEEIFQLESLEKKDKKATLISDIWMP